MGDLQNFVINQGIFTLEKTFAITRNWFFFIS